MCCLAHVPEESVYSTARPPDLAHFKSLTGPPRVHVTPPPPSPLTVIEDDDERQQDLRL